MNHTKMQCMIFSKHERNTGFSDQN